MKAKWEVGTYTVIFDSDGGSEVAAAKVNHGEKVTKPADPTKTGYAFKGWFIGDKEYAFETAVTANITLKAKWEVVVVNYTVTFDSDGGSEVAAAEVKDGGKVTKPADPTKTGYTFKGWLNGETVYDFETAVTANITLKAKWEVVVVNYTVTFDSDGGSEVAAAEVKDGEKVTKPADPTKTGYTFKGWFNGETVYNFETAVTANITLKAKWEVVTYNITYELNGGTGDEGNPKTYTIETADFTIKNLVSGPAATPNFVGWYSDKDLTKPAVTTITKGSTGDLSFYAKWSAKSTFTITFNFVGVEESASATVEDGEALTSEQLESVKSKISSDYEFVDFYTNQECTTKFDITMKFTADFTLYVKVNEIKKFTVTFNSDGGSVVEPAVVKDGAKVPKPADPTRTGYTFKGWLNGADVYNFETAVTADITLKAKWEVVTYTVTFDSDGGSKIESAKVNHGAKVTKPADPTKTGYTFKGWLNGGDNVYNFGTAVTANITLKAKWEVVTYTVTFDSDGGSEVESAKVNHGEKVTKPEDPKKLSYKFIGWNNGTSAYDWESKVNGNLTLTAQWEQLPPLPLWAPKDTAVTNTVTLPSWGYTATYEEDTTFGKVLSLDLGEKSDAGYCKFTIELPTARDLSSKVIKLVFKADGNTNGKIKPVIYSIDGEYSEHNATNVNTASADWEYKYASVADMWDSGEYDGSGNLIANHSANKTQVNKIELAFQNCTANLKIAYLSICDDYSNTNEEIIWSANALSVEDPASWSNATVSYVEDATYGSVYKVETTSEVNYPITNVSFPSPAKDFSAYEYLQITLKASSATEKKLKVSIFTDDAHGSEHNGCNISAEDVGQYKAFSLKLADFWKAYGLDGAADLTKISNLKIEFGKYVGTVEIAEISLY